MNLDIRFKMKKGVTRRKGSHWRGVIGRMPLNEHLREGILGRTPIYILFFIFVSFILSLFSASPAHAQTAVSLGIYPPIYTITTTPPAAIRQPLVIKNYTDSNLTVSIELRSFTSSPSKDGELTYTPPDQPIKGNDPHIFDKIQIFENDHPTTTFTLTPQEAKTLELRINLPQDEPASDYYFSILFINKGVGNDQSNVSAVTAGIGTNVLLSVGPQTATTGSIKSFAAPGFVQHGPVPFTVEIQNNSSHFIVPKGTILVQNMFGQFIGKINLLPVNILEQSSRLIPDEKNLNGTQAVWPEKFLLGLYKAQLTIALSDTGPIFNRTIYFFALPTEAIVACIIVLIIATIVFIRVRKKLRKM